MTERVKIRAGRFCFVILSCCVAGCSLSVQPDNTPHHNRLTSVETVSTVDVNKTEEAIKTPWLMQENIKADPWEPFNRRVFASSTRVDNLFFRPVARTYKYLMPDFFDRGVRNFFSNLGDVGNTVNNVLQGKPKAAFNDSIRLVFNSTIGLGGFLDVASEMGLEKHDEDFGQTLAVWGVQSGPFVMLPFFGPSTARDAFSRFSVDLLIDPVTYFENPTPYRFARILDKRAEIIELEKTISDMGEDQYSVMRDGWLQRRQYLISDGKIEASKRSDLIDQLEALEKE